jgi:hypothetical protein
MTTEERLVNLEKELAGAKCRSRVMLMGAVAAVALVFLLCAGGDATQKVVRAERFELVNANGNVCAAWGMSMTGGGPRLVLCDQYYRPRAQLTVEGDGNAMLVLSNQDGKNRAGLGVLTDGSVVLALSDQNGKTRAGLAADTSGHPGLVLYDQNDRVFWRTP